MIQIPIGVLSGELVIHDLATSSLLAFNKSLDVADQKFLTFSRNIRNAGVGMLPLSLGIGAAAVGVVKLAADFESSFTSVRKTIEATEPEFKKLEQDFRNLAKTLPVTVNEINEVAAAGGQLGVKQKDILEFTRTMVDMGIATNLSSTEAGDKLAQFANIIDNKAGPQYKLLGNVIADLGNKSAATEKQIVQFGLRLAGAGDTAGMTEPQILGLATALASMGLNAEAGSTAFSKILMRMSMAASTGGEALSNFARVAEMDVASFSKLFKEDASEALTVFIEGLGRIKESGGNLFTTLQELGVVEVRLRDSLLRAANAGDLLRTSFDIASVAAENNNALTIEAEKRYATFSSQVVILMNNLKDVGITIGKALIPVLLDLIEMAKPVIDMLARMAEWFAQLPFGVRATTLGFVAFGAILAPLIIVVGQLGIAIAGMITVFTTFSAISFALGNSIPILTARLWYMNAAGGALSGVMAGLAGWLGLVGAAFAGWKLGEFINSFAVVQDTIDKFTLRIGQLVGHIDRDLDVDKFVDSGRKLKEGAKQYKEATDHLTAASVASKASNDRIKDLNAKLSGDTSAQAVFELGQSIKSLRIAGELTPDVLKRIGVELDTLKTSGAKLTPEMESMLKLFKGQAATVGGATDEVKKYTNAVNELSATLSGDGANKEINKLEAAWKKLTPEQQKNADVIKRVVAQYESLRATSSKSSETFEALSKTLNNQTPEWQAIKDELYNIAKHFEDINEAASAKEIEEWAQTIKTEVDGIDKKLMEVADRWTEVYKIESDARNAEGLALMERDALRMKMSLGNQVGLGLRESLQSVPKIITDGLINGQDWGQIGLAVGTKIGSSIGKAVGASIGFALGGELGGKIGGEIGEALGALVGPVFDALTTSNAEKVVKDVGRRWGILISEEMGDEIARQAEQLFQGSHQAAEVFNLDKLLKAGGGLTSDNLGVMTARLRDVFSMMETGAFTSAQGIKVLNEAWGDFADFFEGGLISREMQEIIGLYQRFGVQAREVEEFLQKQAGSAQTGLSGIIKGALKLGEDDKIIGDLTQDQFDRLGRLSQSTFAASVAAGLPFLDVLESMGDSINLLIQAGEQFGLTKLDAFGDITALQAFFDKNQELAESITGTGQLLEALYNSNLLTQQSFDDLGLTAVDTFNKLTAGGLTSVQALMAQQDALQTLWEITQDGTFIVDEQTQALIDQGIEAGLVGEAHMDAQERATRAMEDAADAITGLTDVLAEVFGLAAESSTDFVDTTLSALAKLPKELTFTYRGIYIAPGGPAAPAIPMAEGGMGTVNKPTYFLAGEAGPEDFAFSGANKKFGSAVDDNHSTVHDDFLHQEVRGMRRDLNRAMTRIELMSTREN